MNLPKNKQLLLKQFLEASIETIEDDDRYQDSPADVFVNAPLALIQTSLSSQRYAFKCVLKFINYIDEQN